MRQDQLLSAALEGTRPILIEIQALVSPTSFQMPRRTAVGIDYNRVNLLMAVLEKRVGLQLGGCDAYVNLAGGMKLGEPAIDLGIVRGDRIKLQEQSNFRRYDHFWRSRSGRRSSCSIRW